MAAGPSWDDLSADPRFHWTEPDPAVVAAVRRWRERGVRLIHWGYHQCGYFSGHEVIHTWEDRMTLTEIAVMPPEDVDRLVRRTLVDMADRGDAKATACSASSATRGWIRRPSTCT